MVNIKQLKVGDVVQNLGSGRAYEVVIVDGDHVWAIREVEISNPEEWALIGRPDPDFVGKVALRYLSTEADLTRLLNLVQENQAFFGDPPAGASCIKLATDKLEELIKAGEGYGGI